MSPDIGVFLVNRRTTVHDFDALDRILPRLAGTLGGGVVP
jgi:hypothetical protein